MYVVDDGKVHDPLVIRVVDFFIFLQLLSAIMSNLKFLRLNAKVV